jgi:hypothetical protein
MANALAFPGYWTAIVVDTKTGTSFFVDSLPDSLPANSRRQHPREVLPRFAELCDWTRVNHPETSTVLPHAPLDTLPAVVSKPTIGGPHGLTLHRRHGAL